MTKRLICLGAALALGCGLNANDPYEDLPVVSLDRAPPPIEGGTLLVTAARVAVVADPDRDRVSFVDLETRAVQELALEPGARAGRLVEDGAGRVYVALRGAGRVLELDPATASVTRTLDACATPSGLGHDPATDHLYVACAGGALLAYGPDRALERRIVGPPDLRDVVVTADGVLVTRYRTAQTLRVGAEGATPVAAPPIATLDGVEGRGTSGLRQRYAPGVAARAVATPDRRFSVMLHQRARIGREAVFEGSARTRSYTYSDRPVSNGDVTWRDPCGNAVVHAALTFVDPAGTPLHTAPSIPDGVVPVDVAVSPGGQVAVGFAAEPGGRFAYGPQVVRSSLAEAMRDAPSGCLEGEGDARYDGQVVALAFDGEALLVQLREPARLLVDADAIELGGASVRDTGHDIFHLDTGGGIACASCHPGGGDDGHVWEFAATEPVRTMSLHGAVGLAPYHRAGDVPTFDALMSSLSEQMAGPQLRGDQLAAVERWLGRLPVPELEVGEDVAAVARGEGVFEVEGCATCHAGELGTDGASHRTGDGTWQTPALLGVALRAPYLHDGSAPDLRQAIDAHRRIDHLVEQDVRDLVAYVATR